MDEQVKKKSNSIPTPDGDSGDIVVTTFLAVVISELQPRSDRLGSDRKE